MRRVSLLFLPYAVMTVKPRLLDQLRDKVRLKHLSIRTERAYVQWVRQFIVFHGKRHPETMGPGEVEAFLTYLAVARSVAGQHAESGPQCHPVSVSGGAGP